MAGVSHDVLLLALKENPPLLGELLQRVAGVTWPGPMVVGDSAVKFAVSLEKYPDLLFTRAPPAAPVAPVPRKAARGADAGSAWAMVEVQNRRDERKSRSWHLATSVLLQAHGMGDLIVITASRSVARWATQVAQHRGALGTTKGLTPVVLYLSPAEIDRLLDPAVPQLALFAVWARGRGTGPAARAVASKALEVTAALPPPLQEAQTRAILAMLSEHLLRVLKEMAMDVNQIKETKASRAFRLFFENLGRKQGFAEGEAQGLAVGEARGLAVGEARGLAVGEARGAARAKREALLSVLSARCLTVDEEAAARIDSLQDPDLLDRCIQEAVTATTVAEVLAAAEVPETTRKRPAGRPRVKAGAPPRSNGHKKVNGHAR